MRNISIRWNSIIACLILTAVMFSFSCASHLSNTATWYGEQFNGRRTASGEIFNMTAMTAAHHDLPFNTRVRVTNEQNGKTVIVRINDRVPRSSKCAIDLSKGAFSNIAPIEQGRVPVRIKVLD